MKKVMVSFVFVVAMLLQSTASYAHCQIPCGIYGDSMRFDMIEENLKTIEKSMKEIEELSTEDSKNFNQIVRWVNNKEVHADKISVIITSYFMAQRIKTSAENYEKKVTLLHQMLVTAMKTKQSTDVKQVAKLRALTKEFKAIYLSKKEKAHEAGHKSMSARKSSESK